MLAIHIFSLDISTVYLILAAALVGLGVSFLEAKEKKEEPKGDEEEETK